MTSTSKKKSSSKSKSSTSSSKGGDSKSSGGKSSKSSSKKSSSSSSSSKKSKSSSKSKDKSKSSKGSSSSSKASNTQHLKQLTEHVLKQKRAIIEDLIQLKLRCNEKYDYLKKHSKSFDAHHRSQKITKMTDTMIFDSVFPPEDAPEPKFSEKEENISSTVSEEDGDLSMKALTELKELYAQREKLVKRLIETRQRVLFPSSPNTSLTDEENPLQSIVKPNGTVPPLKAASSSSSVPLPVCSIAEPTRAKAHWDLLLEEMVWMANDFHFERSWKYSTAALIAEEITEKKLESECEENERKETLRRAHREQCKRIANAVDAFWTDSVNVNKPLKVHKWQRRSRRRPRRLSPIEVSLRSAFPRKRARARSEDIEEGAAGLSSQSESSSSEESSEESSDPDFEPSEEEEEDHEMETNEHNHRNAHERAKRRINENIDVALTCTESTTPLEDIITENYAPYLLTLKRKREEITKENELQSAQTSPYARLYAASWHAEIDRDVKALVNAARSVRPNEHAKEHLTFHPRDDEGFEKRLFAVQSGDAKAPTQASPLAPHQRLTVAWLHRLGRCGANAVLADEAGLGKRLALASFLLSLATHRGVNGPHLIVTDAAAIEVWERILSRRCPALVVARFSGESDAADFPSHNVETLQSFNRPGKRFNRGFPAHNVGGRTHIAMPSFVRDESFNVCLVSYSALRAHRKLFLRQKWCYFIADAFEVVWKPFCYRGSAETLDALALSAAWKAQWNVLSGMRCRRRVILSSEMHLESHARSQRSTFLNLHASFFENEGKDRADEEQFLWEQNDVATNTITQCKALSEIELCVLLFVLSPHLFAGRLEEVFTWTKRQQIKMGKLGGSKQTILRNTLSPFTLSRTHKEIIENLTSKPLRSKSTRSSRSTRKRSSQKAKDDAISDAESERNLEERFDKEQLCPVHCYLLPCPPTPRQQLIGTRLRLHFKGNANPEVSMPRKCLRGIALAHALCNHAALAAPAFNGAMESAPFPGGIFSSGFRCSLAMQSVSETCNCASARALRGEVSPQSASFFFAAKCAEVKRFAALRFSSLLGMCERERNASASVLWEQNDLVMSKKDVFKVAISRIATAAKEVLMELKPRKDEIGDASSHDTPPLYRFHALAVNRRIHGWKYLYNIFGFYNERRIRKHPLWGNTLLNAITFRAQCFPPTISPFSVSLSTSPCAFKLMNAGISTALASSIASECFTLSRTMICDNAQLYGYARLYVPSIITQSGEVQRRSLSKPSMPMYSFSPPRKRFLEGIDGSGKLYLLEKLLRKLSRNPLRKGIVIAAQSVRFLNLLEVFFSRRGMFGVTRIDAEESSETVYEDSKTLLKWAKTLRTFLTKSSLPLNTTSRTSPLPFLHNVALLCTRSVGILAPLFEENNETFCSHDRGFLSIETVILLDTESSAAQRLRTRRLIDALRKPSRKDPLSVYRLYTQVDETKQRKGSDNVLSPSVLRFEEHLFTALLGETTMKATRSGKFCGILSSERCEKKDTFLPLESVLCLQSELSPRAAGFIARDVLQPMLLSTAKEQSPSKSISPRRRPLRHNVSAAKRTRQREDIDVNEECSRYVLTSLRICARFGIDSADRSLERFFSERHSRNHLHAVERYLETEDFETTKKNDFITTTTGLFTDSFSMLSLPRSSFRFRRSPLRAFAVRVRKLAANANHAKTFTHRTLFAKRKRLLSRKRSKGSFPSLNGSEKVDDKGFKSTDEGPFAVHLRSPRRRRCVAIKPDCAPEKALKTLRKRRRDAISTKLSHSYRVPRILSIADKAFATAKERERKALEAEKEMENERNDETSNGETPFYSSSSSSEPKHTSRELLTQTATRKRALTYAGKRSFDAQRRALLLQGIECTETLFTPPIITPKECIEVQKVRLDGAGKITSAFALPCEFKSNRRIASHAADLYFERIVRSAPKIDTEEECPEVYREEGLHIAYLDESVAVNVNAHGKPLLSTASLGLGLDLDEPIDMPLEVDDDMDGNASPRFKFKLKGFESDDKFFESMNANAEDLFFGLSDGNDVQTSAPTSEIFSLQERTQSNEPLRKKAKTMHNEATKRAKAQRFEAFEAALKRRRNWRTLRNRTRSRWTDWEDAVIRQGSAIFGANWSLLSDIINSNCAIRGQRRSARQCRERMANLNKSQNALQDRKDMKKSRKLSLSNSLKMNSAMEQTFHRNDQIVLTLSRETFPNDTAFHHDQDEFEKKGNKDANAYLQRRHFLRDGDNGGAVCSWALYRRDKHGKRVSLESEREHYPYRENYPRHSRRRRRQNVDALAHFNERSHNMDADALLWNAPEIVRNAWNVKPHKDHGVHLPGPLCSDLNEKKHQKTFKKAHFVDHEKNWSVLHCQKQMKTQHKAKDPSETASSVSASPSNSSRRSTPLSIKTLGGKNAMDQFCFREAINASLPFASAPSRAKDRCLSAFGSLRRAHRRQKKGNALPVYSAGTNTAAKEAHASLEDAATNAGYPRTSAMMPIQFLRLRKRTRSFDVPKTSPKASKRNERKKKSSTRTILPTKDSSSSSLTREKMEPFDKNSSLSSNNSSSMSMQRSSGMLQRQKMPVSRMPTAAVAITTPRSLQTAQPIAATPFTTTSATSQLHSHTEMNVKANVKAKAKVALPIATAVSTVSPVTAIPVPSAPISSANVMGNSGNNGVDMLKLLQAQPPEMQRRIMSILERTDISQQEQVANIARLLKQPKF